LFKANAGEHEIKLETKIETDHELNGAAVSTIRDALANLVLNALQATPPGGVVTVTARNDKGTLLIIVEDTGTGVPPELSQRIWEPFFTTKQRGTGLGLAIVRKRMEEAGGSARLAASRNGAGARFELRVPIDD
jgi:signal transduction histidine kinase